jgi:ABC-2 type transport system ATP-binding protein
LLGSREKQIPRFAPFAQLRAGGMTNCQVGRQLRTSSRILDKASQKAERIMASKRAEETFKDGVVSETVSRCAMTTSLQRTNAAAVLEAKGLVKRYGALPAVQNVSVQLNAGEVLGCVGPNGAGKSTTVKMLIGLLKPTNGEVLFDGRDINRDLVGYRKCIGYVPEEANLYPYLTGREYLELVATLRGMDATKIGEKIDALLELFSLHASRHSAIASYSKGMRQRILLIAALMDNPKLLILDEPLSGLDVTSALILKNLIKALGEAGRAVFYCSHVLEVVEKVCGQLVVLRKGRVIAYDAPARLRESTGKASLESTFSHLVDEVDTEKISREILQVMSAA